jgi:hypothetical protein
VTPVWPVHVKEPKPTGWYSPQAAGVLTAPLKDLPPIRHRIMVAARCKRLLGPLPGSGARHYRKIIRGIAKRVAKIGIRGDTLIDSVVSGVFWLEFLDRI